MTGRKSCVFCDIVAGAVPASIVCEDDATVAFMDRRQPNEASSRELAPPHSPTRTGTATVQITGAGLQADRQVLTS